MTKKKEENKELNNDKKIDALVCKLEEHEKILANFRMSFQNLESLIVNLKERNRLR